MQQIRVVIIFDLKELSDTIVKSLKPDNINFPEGLGMNMYIDDKLKIIFTCDDVNKMSSMMSIIDEVLEHISIILSMVDEND